MVKRVLGRYPKTVRLPGGESIALRPLQAEDESLLLGYFKDLPADERRMLRDDVTDPSVIHRWCRKIDYDAVFPLLAFRDGKLVADATLHRFRSGWANHVANLRVTVHPSMRRVGLAHVLLDELLEVAANIGIAIVDAEMMDRQKNAALLFEDLGFHTIATLPYHVLDLTQQPHDLVIMSKTLISPASLSPDAHKSVEEVDIGGAG